MSDVTNLPLGEAKRELVRLINHAAEQCRVACITPGAGMDSVYRDKIEQAEEVLDNPEASDALSADEQRQQFPTLSASVGIEANRLSECAAIVQQAYLRDAAIQHEIERTRLAAKAAVRAAPDAESALAAYQAVTWPEFQ